MDEGVVATFCGEEDGVPNRAADVDQHVSTDAYRDTCGGATS
jgi:hypothetical protein